MQAGSVTRLNFPLNLSNITYATHRLVVIHEVTPQTQERCGGYGTELQDNAFSHTSKSCKTLRVLLNKGHQTSHEDVNKLASVILAGNFESQGETAGT